MKSFFGFCGCSLVILRLGFGCFFWLFDNFSNVMFGILKTVNVVFKNSSKENLEIVLPVEFCLQHLNIFPWRWS